MTPDLTTTIAPCGLVCGLCRNATPEKDNCPGCKDGGGDENCHQRQCCKERGLDGCWQCNEFPCGRGYFDPADETWSGLCIGTVECMKQYGAEEYVTRMAERVGDVVEYGDYRFKTPEEVVRAFCADETNGQPER